MLLRIPALLLLTTLCFGADDISWVIEDNVYILEPWVVPQFKAANPNYMLLLYGKGCGNCQWMMGAYKEAAKTAIEQNIPIKFAKMNGLAFKDYSKTLGAKGFPYVHVYGEKTHWGYKYTGKMEAEGFVRELRQHADGTYKPKPDMTTRLTDLTYKEFTNKDYAVVLYTSDKNDNFMYDFINEVLYEMKADGELEVPVGILNVTEFKGVALAEHALEPAVGFRKGIKYDFYPQINIADMKKQIIKRSYAPSQELTLHSIDDPDIKKAYFEGHSTQDVLVAMLPGSNDSQAISEKWRNFCFSNEQFSCAHSYDPKLAQKYKVKGYRFVWTRPDMFVYHSSQPKSAHVPSKTPFKKDADFMLAWQQHLRDQFLPLVGDYDMSHYRDISNWICNTVVVSYFNVDYGDNYEKTMRMMKRIGTVAAKYFTKSGGIHTPIRFAIADETANMALFDKFGLFREDQDDDPIIIIHNIYNHTEHLPSQDEQYEKNMKFESYLESVVERFLGGKLGPFIRSAPPPSRQTYPINTVVRSTLDNVMMDKSKDVVIFFTQEHDCEECKIIMKWLEEITEEIKAEPMRFVQIDISKNDLDRTVFSYQRAPRLLMMPGGEKPKVPEAWPFQMDMNKQQIKRFLGHYSKLSFRDCKDIKKKDSIDDLIKGKDNKKDEL